MQHEVQHLFHDRSGRAKDNSGMTRLTAKMTLQLQTENKWKT